MADKINRINHKHKSISKIFKRAIALFIIVIINFNSYAAVISSNDGSAFITKAEFDALVNDFNSRIEDYEKSIDAKIDGAIAEYLAGLATTAVQAIEQMSNYSDIRWMHGPYMYFTKRKFDSLDANDYTDTTRWQKLSPENRRNINGDAYIWFHDTINYGFAGLYVTARMYPLGGWKKNLGFTYNNNVNSAGPVAYVQADNTSDGWLIDKDLPIAAEFGFGQNIFSTPHAATVSGFGTTVSSHLNDDIVSNLSVTDVSNDGDILGYKITNITTNNASVKGELESHVRKIDTPSYPLVALARANRLWSTGTNSLALRTGCGYAGYGLSNDKRVDDGLIEDIRWRTENQFKADSTNFRYALYGSDDDSEMNFGPKLTTTTNGSYVDLSSSGHSTSYTYFFIDFQIFESIPHPSLSVPKYIKDERNLGETGGGYTMSIPLWYRQRWGQFLSPDFMTLNSGKYLKKNAGYPIMEKAPYAGDLHLTIKYQELSNTDTSVVTLTPDNKIKTYFKKGSFDSSSSTYLNGWKNFEKTGSSVSLNGTEWTDGTIKLCIEVNAGDSIWMRIDPLTSDGVYCKMTSIEAELHSYS